MIPVPSTSAILSASRRCLRRCLAHHRGPLLVGGHVLARTHMNHGGVGGTTDGLKLPLEAPGPRIAGLEIGLDSATSVHNILRLLESSHGQYSHTSSTQSTAWHAQLGQIWEYDDNGWNIASQQQTDDNKLITTTNPTTPARLLDLKFSDSRTALVKLIGSDGRFRYLSLLQLEDNKPLNDGWILMREVIGGTSDQHHYHTRSFVSLKQVLGNYFSIEHGGGLEDKEAAEFLFHPQSFLLAVGSDDEAAAYSNSEWSAPVGSVLEISLATYLNGVLFQTTQDFEVTKHDAIVALDILPCGTAAAATVRVGNGACTRIFEDHLLMGRCQSTTTSSSSSSDRYTWQILSKTFSPQAWPHQHHLEEGAGVEDVKVV